MSFIRTHIENRSIFMLMLITFLCISYLVCATSLIHAAGPLVILGVAITAKLVWQVIAAGSTAYTLYQIIRSQIKTLDEKIADLEKEVPKLYDRKNVLEKRYKTRKGYVQTWEGRLAMEESALTAATAAVTAAETAKNSAEKVYKASASSRDTAKHAYMDHSCSTCYQYGTSNCSESVRLHTAWQSWVSQAKTDKAAYDAAKTTLKAKKKEEKAAKSAVATAKHWKSFWTARMNGSYSAWQSAKGKHAEKKADLEQKRIERGLRQAELDVAMGDVDGAKKGLNDLQAQNPDAWTRVLNENPGLREAVDEVLNYDTE